MTPESEIGVKAKLSTRWRARLLLIAAVYFTLIGGTLTTDFSAWARLVHHALVTVVCAVWLVSRLRRGEGFPPTPLDIPLLALFAVYALATVLAVDPRVSAEALWLLGVHILLLAMIVDVMRTGGPRAALEPVFFAASVVILVGLAEFAAWYFGLPIVPIFQQGWFAISGLRDPLPPTIYRLSFTLNVSTWLSAFMAMLIPVGLAWAVHTRSRDTRRALILWLAGAVVIEGLSFSRGGLLSLAVSLPTLATLLALGRPAWRLRIAALLHDWRVIAAGVILVGVAAFVAIGWTTQSAVGHQSGDRQRLDLWRSAWQIGLADPLSGAGPYGFGRELRTVRDPLATADHMTTPHNAVLLVWSDAGLPGVLALAGVAAALLWAAYRRWRASGEGERAHLAGALAGLAGFAAHNMVDNFPVTPVLLPALALAAFVVYPRQPGAGRTAVRRAVALGALALVMVSAGGWALSDIAQLSFERSIRLADAGRTGEALSAIRAARRLDPVLGMYAAQEATTLGLLAAEDSAYLDPALASHREMLDRYEGTYDLIRANYAMLLTLDGDMEEARRQMETAARIQPRQPRYALWSGVLSETLGDLAQARTWYIAALEYGPDWIGAPFWEISEVRREARAAYLEQHDLSGAPVEELAGLAPLCWPTDVLPQYFRGRQRTAAEIDACAGQRIWRVDASAPAALDALESAIAADPGLAAAYAERASVLLSEGDLTGAERDARTAVFLGDAQGGYTVLGYIAERQGDVQAAEAAYLSGGPVEVQLQGWDVAVYYRKGSLRLLPILDAPGPGRYSLASWIALEQLYRRQGRLEEARIIGELLQSYGYNP